ncbi:MOP flippase family protein [Roseivirga spongicola]|uniref:MOP flippase family protein n=1 Tax=Roseivirga spongicola TaxID=333140 RepID=UPI002AC9AFEE|nr:MOP flippase family protein [Roseivirga spongicola]WPZ09167.1 MOP flippase family protein [Roseivirga spongicola]
MVKLRALVFKGVFWSFVNQVGVQLLQLATTAVLARLLVPEDFGLMAMLAIATGFINVIKDFGIGASLVQKKEVDNEEYSTVFWLNLAIGGLLCVLVYLLALPIAIFFEDVRLKGLMEFISLSFFLNSFGIVWSNILLKNLDFKQIFYRNFLATLLSSTVAIALALKGHGYWALAVQVYVRLVSNLIFNYLRVRWLPEFVFKKAFLSDVLKFSLPLFADKSVNYWMRNVDNLLVGKFLGKSELAFYSKAYSLMLLPVRQLSGTITKVLFPSFSLIQDDPDRIGRVYLKISRVIAFAAFPVMLLLAFKADTFILIVYGDQWERVIPIFRVLSILGMFQAIGTLSGNIYLSQGRTLLMFKVGIFSRALMIMGIVIGLWQGGLMGMVYGYSITAFIAFLPELYFMGKLINLRLWQILKNFLPYLLIAMLSVLSLLLIDFKFSLLVDLILSALVMGGVYLFFAKIFKLTALDDLIYVLRKRG